MSFRTFFDNLKSYLLSKEFWFTVAKISVFVLVVVFATSFYLKLYTQHGKQIYTPTLLGMNIDEAKKYAAQKGLRVKVIEEVYEGIGEPGDIVDQTPPPNFMVKKGRVIFVTIKSLTPKKIPMPRVRDLSVLQAKYELEQAGLKVGNITEVSSPYKGLVLDQLYDGKPIKPGELIEVGSKIDLLVGSGYGTDTLDVDTTVVPSDAPQQQSDDFDF